MDKLIAQEKIEYIMHNFDFLSVLEYMKSVNWTYRGEAVCSVDTITSMARQVLQTAVYDEHCANGHALVLCGGFEARIDKWDSSDLYFMTLSFAPFCKCVTF
jgi:hypothetical protein